MTKQNIGGNTRWDGQGVRVAPGHRIGRQRAMSTRVKQTRFVHRVALAVVLLAICGSVGLSQVRSEFVPQLFGVGARSTALADTYVSEILDVTSMYANPASVRLLRSGTVSLSHLEEWSQNSMRDNLTFPVYRGAGEAIAAGASVNHIGKLRSSPSVNYEGIQYMLSVAYARELVPDLTIGFGVTGHYSTAGTSKVWTGIGSVGLLYSPDPVITYGATLGSFGNDIAYQFANGATTLLRRTLSRHLEVGATMRLPSGSNQPKFVLSFANQKILDTDGLVYKIGLEYTPIDILSLRAGYRVDPDVATARYGMGLHVKRFRLDWAIAPSKLLDQMYQVTLSYEFKSAGMR